METDPPFHKTYKALIEKTLQQNKNSATVDNSTSFHLYNKKHVTTGLGMIEECELPVVDLSVLIAGGKRDGGWCKAEIARASKEWGFFQVLNHGISREILENMRKEQSELFKQPFERKSKEEMFHNLPTGTYRWGTPTATRLDQLCWSEAFHIPMTDIATPPTTSFASLSSAIEQFATAVAKLAQMLAGILADELSQKSSFFLQNCLPETCYLRLNRYPPCPIPTEIFGLMPHTDSDFLTILHQDQVGGLQLVKDGKWFAVKPNPEVLIINIGDLFQAWSNGIYKSVEHRVVANPHVERFSTAYFFCPSDDTEIDANGEPSVYKKFIFRDYRQQVRQDVKKFGYKIGLSSFLL